MNRSDGWRRAAIKTLVLVSACATPAASSEGLAPGALNRAALRASRPRSIALAKMGYVAFDTQTSPPGAVFLGVVGVVMAAAMAPGDEATTNGFRMQDPAVAIRAAVLARLARRFGMTVISEAEAQGEQGAPVATDLTLAIDTSTWGIMPTRIGHYGVKYRGTLRLTDNRSHQVIAEGECTSLPVDTPDTPTFDEMQGNEGAVLRASLAATADYCIDDYRKRILGLY